MLYNQTQHYLMCMVWSAHVCLTLCSTSISDNFYVDIMHDVLEGIVQFELKIVLCYVQTRFLTTKELAGRLHLFNYGYTERRNREQWFGYKSNSVLVSSPERATYIWWCCAPRWWTLESTPTFTANCKHYIFSCLNWGPYCLFETLNCWTSQAFQMLISRQEPPAQASFNVSLPPLYTEYWAYCSCVVHAIWVQKQFIQDKNVLRTSLRHLQKNIRIAWQIPGRTSTMTE